jgi:hypothetical protein
MPDLESGRPQLPKARRLLEQQLRDAVMAELDDLPLDELRRQINDACI